ncbi:hypothetical protein Sste5346_008849 [Sporothrix stenoceras]|uniref:Carboxylic ester hydrolase n=1 Tax=Sporothrix stenoceras TaxID=5173 RepID=A0ABR3YME8_9PEZI
MHHFKSLAALLPGLTLLANAAPASKSRQATTSDPLLVDLGYASYKGTTLVESGVNHYLGIRFAQPPVGDLRWRAPQDPLDESSLGVQQAVTTGAMCIGINQPVVPGSYVGAIDEDCLFLSVYTPTGSTPDSNLPVWVFIQGGGYAVDANSNLNGTAVVAAGHDIVFVQFNYRVGMFGFLASESIQENGDLNVGLLDQRKALQWVQDYIHLFGGDPNHVVIHGASAGGGSVAHHMAAYGGRDDSLFVGAMPESPFFPTCRSVADMEFQFDNIAAATGCSAQTDPLACLRALDLNTLQALDYNMAFPNTTGIPDYYFLPVIDGDFVRDQMSTQFNNGDFVYVPTMVGGDTNEGDTFVPDLATQAEAGAFLVDQFPKLTVADLAVIDAAYPPIPRDAHADYFGQVSATYGNATFACPGLLISKAVSQYVGEDKSWSYLYNVVDPGVAAGVGVTHTVEWQYIFGLSQQIVTTVMMDYYLSFVRTLDPNPYRDAGTPVFDNFNSQELNRLVINTPLSASGMAPVSSEQLAGCNVWYSLSAVTEQ